MIIGEIPPMQVWDRWIPIIEECLIELDAIEEKITILQIKEKYYYDLRIYICPADYDYESNKEWNLGKANVIIDKYQKRIYVLEKSIAERK